MKTNNIFQQYGNSPVALFGRWFAEAAKSEAVDPDAMALATADQNGQPHVRIVLLKKFSDEGFVFYTNYAGGKARDLAANPRAEANFYWKSLSRQVRITGAVEKISAAESDEYFKTRERGKQIGAWASAQSEGFEDYALLDANAKETEARFAGQEIPRPPHWGGYILRPERIEFWMNEQNRLHTRFAYIKSGKEWQSTWLFP